MRTREMRRLMHSTARLTPVQRAVLPLHHQVRDEGDLAAAVVPLRLPDRPGCPKCGSIRVVQSGWCCPGGAARVVRPGWCAMGKTMGFSIASAVAARSPSTP